MLFKKISTMLLASCMLFSMAGCRTAESKGSGSGSTALVNTMARKKSFPVPIAGKPIISSPMFPMLPLPTIPAAPMSILPRNMMWKRKPCVYWILSAPIRLPTAAGRVKPAPCPEA